MILDRRSPPGLPAEIEAWSTDDMIRACRMVEQADEALDDWRLAVGAAVVHSTPKFTGERNELVNLLAHESGVSARTIYRWVEAVERELLAAAGFEPDPPPRSDPWPTTDWQVEGERSPSAKPRTTITWPMMIEMAAQVEDADVCRRVAALWLDRLDEIEEEERRARAVVR